jgi:S1-C subfamily serine protease
MNSLMKFFTVLGLAYVGAVAFTNCSWAADQKKEMFIPSVQIGDYCSGTIIHSEREKATGDAETYVLTAKHCTSKVDERVVVNVADYDDRLRRKATVGYDGKVIGQSYKSDLALIRLNDKDKIFENVAEVAPSDTKVEFGQQVYVVAYPVGRSETFTIGTLGYVEIEEFFKDLSNTSEFFRATPDIAGGSSGGAMFAEVAGKYQIIGTVTGGYRAFSFVNLFTPFEEINEYLDVAKKSWKTEIEKEKEAK